MGRLIVIFQYETTGKLITFHIVTKVCRGYNVTGNIINQYQYGKGAVIAATLTVAHNHTTFLTIAC
jgi:hypothetical protein